MIAHRITLSVAFLSMSFAAIPLLPPASAELTEIQVVPVDNSSVLSDFVTQDIMFSTDTKLVGATMYMKLTTGSVFNDSIWGDVRSPPASLVASQPSAEFDTFFDGPTDKSLVFPAGPIIDEKRVFGTWAALGTTQSGRMRALRLTMSEDAIGAIGMLQLVTDLPNQSWDDIFFLDANHGALELIPGGPESILSGEHRLSGTQSLTAIRNPGTVVTIPKNTLVMHDLISDEPIRIGNEAKVEFDGGILYAPGHLAQLTIDSGAELHVRDGHLRFSNIDLSDGGRLIVDGGIVGRTISRTQFGIRGHDAEILFSGGEVGIGVLASKKKLSISGGEISLTSDMQILGGKADISGGLLDVKGSLQIFDGELLISGGNISIGEHLDVQGGTLRIAGGSFNLEPGPVLDPTGLISGVLADGSPFSVEYRLQGEGQIVLNPEPDTLGLLLFCSWLPLQYRRRRCR